MWLPVNLQALGWYKDVARSFKAEEMFDLCSVCPFVCLALKKIPKYFKLQMCPHYRVFSAIMRIM